MRDIVVVLLIFGSLPFCLSKPHLGIYMWFLVALLNPHRLAYGFSHNMAPALFVGAATLLGILINVRQLRIPSSREAGLLLVLWILFTFNTVVALFPYYAWLKWQQVTKILLMTFATMLLIRDQRRLRMLLLVVGLSIGLYAAKAVPWAIATGGRYRLRGPTESFIGSNNDIGLALNMAIPLLAFLAQTDANRWIRLVCRGTMLASILSVVLTYSRGALLGLVAVVSFLVLRSHRKVLTGALLAGCVVAVLAFVPPQWFERMYTIRAYEQDESALSRIDTWRFAWDLAVQRPFTGGGFQAFRANPSEFDSHSVYFGMLAEQGFLALFLFLLLIAGCFFTLQRVRRLSKRQPTLGWHSGLAGMLQVSLIAYMVNGLTLGHQYFDLFYLMVAMVAILGEITQAEAVRLTQAERDAGTASLRDRWNSLHLTGDGAQQMKAGTPAAPAAGL